MSADAVTITDPMLQFADACDRKHAAGVAKYRGGDFSKPFNNADEDAVTRYCNEQTDSANYLLQDLNEGLISQEEYEYGFRRHFEMWWWRRERGR